MLNSLLAWPNQPYIKIFGQEIYWYAIIIVCGMLSAFGVISLLFKRRNMSPDLFLTFFVIGLPIAILTTRLFYCITDGMPISQWFNWESIRSGGLSIVGGIIGGAASVIVICAVKKVNFFRVGDCVVVGLLLAQSIGRWGNFVNQEVFGGPVTNEALQWFPFAVYIYEKPSMGIEEGWYYAFFFYESMVTLTASILMFINGWKNGKKPNGINTACYFIVYGLTRTVMEPLRNEGYILQGGGVPWSLVTSILLLVSGIGLLFFVLFTNKRKEGALLGSKRGDPFGITKYLGDKKNETAYLDNMNMMCAVYPENYVKKPPEEDKKWWEFWKKDKSDTAETPSTTEMKTENQTEDKEDRVEKEENIKPTETPKENEK